MRKKPKEIAIYGAGGFGRELAWLVQSCDNKTEAYNIACFIDDDEKKQGKTINGFPVISLENARKSYPKAFILVSAGNPKTRKNLIEKTARLGFNFTTIIHPNVEISQWVKIGRGTVICAGSILTTNISIGDQVQINLDCTIGHDVILGDYSTLAPGVHISGWVHVGEQVYFGTGAVIINGSQDSPLTIGKGAVIGAGACVIKSIPSGKTVVGVPGRAIK